MMSNLRRTLPTWFSAVCSLMLNAPVGLAIGDLQCDLLIVLCEAFPARADLSTPSHDAGQLSTGDENFALYGAADSERWCRDFGALPSRAGFRQESAGQPVDFPSARCGSRLALSQ
jgi:hypothetical protein